MKALNLSGGVRGLPAHNLRFFFFLCLQLVVEWSAHFDGPYLLSSITLTLNSSLLLVSVAFRGRLTSPDCSPPVERCSQKRFQLSHTTFDLSLHFWQRFYLYSSLSIYHNFILTFQPSITIGHVFFYKSM